MESVFSHLPITDSTWIFLLVLLIILLAPMVLRPLKIPYILGMIIAGVVIGPFGLNILARDKSFELFGQVGLNYIMFLAALEMDTRSLFKNGVRYLLFGLATFAIPFALTFVCSRYLLGFNGAKSLLMSCILSSNTLIAYPIISRYGLGRHKSVSYSVGGTMISLLLSLIVVAAVSSSWELEGDDRVAMGLKTLMFWGIFAAKIVLFGVGAIFIIPRITRAFLRRYSDSVLQFIFVIVILCATAACAQLCGIEGILGAFLAGLILNRYIPKVSPLMNRIEFVGNALFIPYFLIGVGMMINIRSLYGNPSAIDIILFMVVLGTLGKGIAAYACARILKMSWTDGHVMFGLTTAHAAGAIAIMMVGTRLTTNGGEVLMGDDILNGIVMMILITCIISSFVTEHAAKKLVLITRDETASSGEYEADDEKILVLVKDEKKAMSLINTAVLTRNQKLNRGLIALNVVNDDPHSIPKQREGRELLERLEKAAASMDVRMQTQTRLATNLANGITHAFKEYDASELVAGTHFMVEGATTTSYGYLIEELTSQVYRQIMLVNLKQPLSTIRKIHVVIPNNAQYEPGFYRWAERVARMAENLSCRIVFRGKEHILQLLRDYMMHKHKSIAAEYVEMSSWDGLAQLGSSVAHDHLLIVVTARKGTLSYQSNFDRLPLHLTQELAECNQLVIFPDQFGKQPEAMTFTNV
ncbi:MAG: cation:proton antiporter [Prevotellaceae bacterium]|nr:cation:proton antiporter [Prevotellaceae bacterium]